MMSSGALLVDAHSHSACDVCLRVVLRLTHTTVLQVSSLSKRASLINCTL